LKNGGSPLPKIEIQMFDMDLSLTIIKYYVDWNVYTKQQHLVRDYPKRFQYYRFLVPKSCRRLSLGRKPGTTTGIPAWLGIYWKKVGRDTIAQVPESTAPDALRHWTTEQKQYLQKSSKGRRLVELEEKQQLLWEQKYYHSDSRKRAANTLPQFLWAMKVVHSRAFCGDFGSLNPAYLIVSLSVPIIATLFGYKSLIDSYTSYTTGYNEVIAIL